MQVFLTRYSQQESRMIPLRSTALCSVYSIHYRNFLQASKHFPEKERRKQEYVLKKNLVRMIEGKLGLGVGKFGHFYSGIKGKILQRGREKMK